MDCKKCCTWLPYLNEKLVVVGWKPEVWKRPACISHQAAMKLVKALPMIGYRVLTDKQTVSETPIPALASPGTAELGLHSIHSYGYASHCSPAFICTCPAPCLGILVRNAG